MGLEISDELFFPITPIRTSITRNLNSTVSPLSVNNTIEKNKKKTNHHVNKKAKRIIIDENCNNGGSVEFTKLPDLVSTTKLQQDLVNTTEFDGVVKAREEEEEECSTPKAEDNLLKTPLVCPPAPRKPKPLKRKNGFSSSSSPAGLFFQQVPMDLSSVFFAVPLNSKKIRAEYQISNATCTVTGTGFYPVRKSCGPRAMTVTLGYGAGLMRRTTTVGSSHGIKPGTTYGTWRILDTK